MPSAGETIDIESSLNQEQAAIIRRPGPAFDIFRPLRDEVRPGLPNGQYLQDVFSAPKEISEHELSD